MNFGSNNHTFNMTFEEDIVVANTDYSALSNKPKIEGVELSGNKTAGNLGLAKASDIIPNDGQTIINQDDILKTAVGGYCTSSTVKVVDGDFDIQGARVYKTLDSWEPFSTGPESVSCYISGTIVTTENTHNIAWDYTFTDYEGHIRYVVDDIASNIILYVFAPTYPSSEMANTAELKIDSATETITSAQLTCEVTDTTYSPIDSNYLPIVDNVTTNDATKVLSAKQGKVLKDLIDAMEVRLSALESV